MSLTDLPRLTAGTMIAASMLWGAVSTVAVAADDPPQNSPLYEEMVRRIEAVKIDLSTDNGLRPCQLHERPVFRYSDQEREIEDATLWLWTDESGRPAALEKEEACAFRQRPQWTVCWASLSPDLIHVKWDRTGRDYTTTKPGCDFKPIPGEIRAAQSEAQLKLQIRQTSKRFQSTFDGGKTQGRTFPKAIYEYRAPDQGVQAGAVFGLSAYGTNPDGYLVIEARKIEDRTEFVYGCARMTTTSIDVSLDGDPAWSCAATDTQTIGRENWLFFFEPRPETVRTP